MTTIVERLPATMYDSAPIRSESEQSAHRTVELLPFFNETDILQARLRLMVGYVDQHIVCEADHTHQGDTKPLYLDGFDLPANVHRIKATLPGTNDLTAPFDAEQWNWKRERWQRDIMGAGLQHIVRPDDLVLSCDVDEFVIPHALNRIYQACQHGPVALGMRMIYYGTRENPAAWIGAKAFRARHMPDSLTTLRFGSMPVVPDCGWHLSYLGDTARRRRKVEAFLHPENRPGTPAWDRIEAAMDGPNGETLVDFDPAELPVTLRELVG